MQMEKYPVEARQLQTNKLLPLVLAKIETDLICKWRSSGTIDDRENAWHALRQLDIIAGAIENAIKEHSTD